MVRSYLSNNGGGIIGVLHSGSIVSEVEVYNSTVHGSGNVIGGLVGSMSDSIITDGITNANVDGGYIIGGAVGYMSDGEIENVYSSGDVISNTVEPVKFSYRTGGLVGENNGGIISHSYATGSVLADGYTVGGLVGENNGTIINTYSTGNVESADSSIGGLVGYNSFEGVIQNSYSTGNIMGVDRVGGLVGFNDGIITNSFSTATSIIGDSRTGGSVGDTGGDNLFNLAWVIIPETNAIGDIGYGEVCSITGTQELLSDGGEDSDCIHGTGHVVIDELKYNGYEDEMAPVYAQNNESAWDFETVWTIETDHNGENNGLPYFSVLFNEEEPPSDDNDGIPTEVEDAGPNAGDANDDGILDSEKANVVSFVNPINDEYVVVEIVSECDLFDVSINTEAVNTVQDIGYDYYTSLINFSADCGTPGFTATVSVYQYGITQDDLVLRKYNPDSESYFTIEDVEFSQQTIDEQLAVIATYSITDNGDLDLNSEEGVITDPVGFATNVVGVPNTGLGGLR